MTFAQQNAATAFDCGQKLVLATDAATLLALHSELISAQMRSVLRTSHDGGSKHLW